MSTIAIVSLALSSVAVGAALTTLAFQLFVFNRKR